ncbi:RNA polymerase sigma factor, sigma-70 family [Tessaracoccus bendigoensis DSM 12906]|uniref:RNA polymerase sigma factor, sigma-70 family n=1 Tax=Tessaracoccus bendigoensis DSM 12906 TaxID=1123357 RepID=A0A1M6M4U1_9ACTN|nr:sigma factor-like helix-turn-helix DNA-binding protein [Tessaracoccus bendigoensis]SHJ78437.1 RNA polymerase sigma factor, sigma-70 family [Tessaracoccus bendigoensis DSM 12906]
MENLNIPLVWLADGEDVALARCVEAGLYAQHLIDTRGDDDLLRRVVEEGTKAMEILWWVGLRVGGKVAARLAINTGVSQEELFQQAALGVATAVRSYDHARGFRYTTFVHHVAAQALSDVDQLRVCAPGSTRGDRRAVRLAERARGDDLEIPLEEAASAAGVSVSSVARGTIRNVSFDPEAAADETAQDGFDKVMRTGLGFLELLSTRHRAVLQARYLSSSKTFDEIAAEFRVSSTTVMRWERSAIREARAVLDSDRTVSPSVSRGQPIAAASSASQARSTGRTARGGRKGP